MDNISNLKMQEPADSKGTLPHYLQEKDVKDDLGDLITLADSGLGHPIWLATD